MSSTTTAPACASAARVTRQLPGQGARVGAREGIDVGAARLERDHRHASRDKLDRLHEAAPIGDALDRERHDLDRGIVGERIEHVWKAHIRRVPETDAEPDPETLPGCEERERVVHAPALGDDREAARRKAPPPCGRSSRRASRAARRSPDVFGPRILRPVSAAIDTSSAWSASPAGPASAQPPEWTIAAPAPVSAHSRRTPGTASAGTATSTRSTVSPMLESRSTPGPPGHALATRVDGDHRPGKRREAVHQGVAGLARRRGCSHHRDRPWREEPRERGAHPRTLDALRHLVRIDARRPAQLEAVARPHPVVAGHPADEGERAGQRAQLRIDAVVPDIDAHDARDHERVRGNLGAAEVDDLVDAALERGGRLGDARRGHELRRGAGHAGDEPLVHLGPELGARRVRALGQALVDRRDRQLARLPGVSQRVLVDPGAGARADPDGRERMEREGVEERERRQVRPAVRAHASRPRRSGAERRGRSSARSGRAARAAPDRGTSAGDEGGAQGAEPLERDLDHVTGGEVRGRIHPVADPAGRPGRDQVAGAELDHLGDVGDQRGDVEDEVADHRLLAHLLRSRSS